MNLHEGKGMEGRTRGLECKRAIMSRRRGECRPAKRASVFCLVNLEREVPEVVLDGEVIRRKTNAAYRCTYQTCLLCTAARGW